MQLGFVRPGIYADEELHTISSAYVHQPELLSGDSGHEAWYGVAFQIIAKVANLQEGIPNFSIFFLRLATLESLRQIGMHPGTVATNYQVPLVNPASHSHHGICLKFSFPIAVANRKTLLAVSFLSRTTI